MWGIAIILIGGIYWTYRVINEKTNEEVLERYRNNADEINNKIKATLDEEISIRKKLKDIGTRWIMLDSISDDLTKIYGSDWRTYFQDDSKVESEYSDKSGKYLDYLPKHIRLAVSERRECNISSKLVGVLKRI